MRRLHLLEIFLIPLNLSISSKEKCKKVPLSKWLIHNEAKQSFQKIQYFKIVFEQKEVLIKTFQGLKFKKWWCGFEKEHKRPLSTPRKGLAEDSKWFLWGFLWFGIWYLLFVLIFSEVSTDLDQEVGSRVYWLVQDWVKKDRKE